MTSTDVGKMGEEVDIIQQKEGWKMDGKSIFYCIMQFFHIAWYRILVSQFWHT